MDARSDANRHTCRSMVIDAGVSGYGIYGGERHLWRAAALMHTPKSADHHCVIARGHGTRKTPY
jgi:hypothetical protein